MNSKDNLFNQVKVDLTPFEFDQHVAEVFEDMIQRSVPGYRELVEQIGILSLNVVQPETNVYDLGTSLGAVTMAIRRRLNDPSVTVFAVDNSNAMIKRCRLLAQAYQSDVALKIIEQDINNIAIENASLVVLNFTLQFIPQQHRKQLLRKIYDGMVPGGILVLSEKMANSNSHLDELIQTLHEDFKRSQGYSELEISQKREALQNVLIPETRTAHSNRLTEIGFDEISLWYQQYNFASLLAVKK